MIATGPAERLATRMACSPQGSVRASNAQESTSSRPVLTLAATSGASCSNETDSAARAMRRASAGSAKGDFAEENATGLALARAGFAGPLALLSHLHARPAFDWLDDLGHVGFLAFAAGNNGEHLAHRAAHHHGHAQRIGFLQAQADVLVQQADGKAEIEGSRYDAARNFVHGGGIAAAAGIDDI